MNQRAQKLEAIIGAGPITALGMSAELSELGALNRLQAALLAGVAPHPRQSGAWQGRRAIGVGRAAVRRALSMAAPVAARANLTLRVFCRRLRAAGKPTKAALTGVMRKPVILMNHALKHLNLASAN